MKRKTSGPRKERRRLQLRINLVAGVVVFSLVAVVARAYYLQVIKHEYYLARQQQQSSSNLLVQCERGDIRSADGGAMAINVKGHSLYAEPRAIKNQSRLARQLAPLLELPVEVLERRLGGGGGFVWLRRSLTPVQVEALQPWCKENPGLALLKENQRVYPNRELAGQIMGFTDIDGRGLEGLERHYEKYLRGQQLFLSLEHDARRQVVESSQYPELEYYKGKTVYLTLNRHLQVWAEQELESAVLASRGKGGVALVMDAADGAILAIAQYPRFNPNSKQKNNPVLWRNRAVTDLLEPGSTFKVFTLVAALESGVFSLADRIDCEEGSFQVGGRAIHDTHEHGLLRLDEIIKYSSNIGCSKMVSAVGAEDFYKVLQAFGVGSKSGIDFPGEPAGQLRHWLQWQPIDLCNLAFGQGLALTSVQLTAAYAALANGGYRVTPYLVSKIVNGAGWTVYEHAPKSRLRRACSPQVAAQIDQALGLVVEDDGTAPQARISGLRVAGKTGTAQKFDFGEKKYSHKDYWASFIGYVDAPAGQSRKVVYVMVDEPRTSIYGGMVAAPAFRRLNQRLAGYFNYYAENGETELALSLLPSEASESDPAADSTRKNLEGPEDPVTPQIMPDFTGRTIREALARVGAYRGRVRISGEGRIVAQEPAPGTRLVPGQNLNFSLRRES
ncbi:MAG: transpeptidase family protein [Deltaproteobacteria bacterium]|nr:transpeptidase family protein [Deltaproteobacteria bacterium]